MIDQLTDEQTAVVEMIVAGILANPVGEPPCGDLGLIERFDRNRFYDETITDRS